MELQVSLVFKIIVSILLLGFIRLLVRLFDALVLKPERLRAKLREQGIQGPPPSFLIGNTWDMMKTRFKDSKMSPQKQGDKQQQVITHNTASSVFPSLEEWRKQYGPTYLFSLGNIMIVHTIHPDVVKEVQTYTSYDFGRSSLQQSFPFFGKKGILGTRGEQWSRQRKILGPEFFMDKVKDMTEIMVESALMVVKSWRDKIDSEGGEVVELKIDDYMRSFSADVLVRTSFARNYEEGEQIFMKIKALKDLMAKIVFLHWIPGLRYLPIKSNREIWRLEKEFRALIFKVIKERNEAKLNSSSGKDLFQIIVEGAERIDLGGKEAKTHFILDNCKNIYFAGHDTTAISASWTLMLLALHPEWQDKARQEVLEICGGKLPDSDMLPKMKILTMVIYESLRLYPPGSIMPREAVEDLKLGGIQVPKGVNIWIIIVALHHDPNLWGPDVHNFNPERFSNGVSGACKFPQVYIPFGCGPHTCLGQFFAMAELKILLALILSNFRFTLSPTYRHSPMMNMLIEPEHGVDLLIRRL